MKYKKQPNSLYSLSLKEACVLDFTNLPLKIIHDLKRIFHDDVDNKFYLKFEYLNVF